MRPTFLVDPADTAQIENHLRALGWLHQDRVLSAEKAGDGNMNLTLRLQLERQSVILKQARPWVEKYPQIPAPVHRAVVEAAFYRAVAGEPAIAGHMPALLGADAESCLLLLEDLAEATDLMALYSGERLTEAEAEELMDYLNALHSLPVTPEMASAFRNRDMRALNHAHQFDLPLRPNGTYAWAAALRSDTEYKARVSELGRLYLADGNTLLHGDYFPGAWMRTPRGIFVIDPEFCFAGPAEFDLGILRAHLIFTRQEEIWPTMMARYCGPADWALAERFAGAELMRRLIGVAQLPLMAGEEQKQAWLQLSRRLVCG